jgi:hypothetical protein
LIKPFLRQANPESHPGRSAIRVRLAPSTFFSVVQPFRNRGGVHSIANRRQAAGTSTSVVPTAVGSGIHSPACRRLSVGWAVPGGVRRARGATRRRESRGSRYAVPPAGPATQGVGDRVRLGEAGAGVAERGQTQQVELGLDRIPGGEPTGVGRDRSTRQPSSSTARRTGPRRPPPTARATPPRPPSGCDGRPSTSADACPSRDRPQHRARPDTTSGRLAL